MLQCVFDKSVDVYRSPSLLMA